MLIEDRGSGSTTRNIAGMLPMETGKRRISTVEANAAKAEEELAPAVVILARPIARVEELALAIGPVAAVDLAIALAAGRELEHVRVEAERERAQAAAVPGRDLVAGAPRTKSATTVLLCGLLAVLAAEDLTEAVAETMHAPAAAEAAVAWAVVG